MILVGIDDTDTIDTPGTNQLARALVAELADEYRCRLILRHQLFFDSRIPYTSKNGSASIHLEPRTSQPPPLEDLIARLRQRMRTWFVPGSDPGLCVAERVPGEVLEYALRCQGEVMDKNIAYRCAASAGIHLEELGGTGGGVIGALAAVGLAAGKNDGRVVVNGEWPDDLSGRHSVDLLRERGVRVQCLASGRDIKTGCVDVGKHLRPNLRDGEIVLFVEPCALGESEEWRGIRLV